MWMRTLALGEDLDLVGLVTHAQRQRGLEAGAEPLERQQAQLKTAEVEMKRANKNGRNVIEEFEGGEGGIMGEGVRLDLSKKKEEIKLVGNFDSNWDDSDEDGDGEHVHGGDDDWEKGGLLASLGGNDKEDEDEEGAGLRDAWDD